MLIGNGFQPANAIALITGSGLAGRDVTRCQFGFRCRRVARSQQVVGDRLVLIESDRACVGANKALVENASGQLAELFFLERLEHTRSDFGGGRNLVERDFSLLSFQLQFFAEGWQRGVSLSLDGKRNSTLRRG